MSDRQEFIELLKRLQTIAKRYHRFQEDPESFLEAIHRFDEDRLREFLESQENWTTQVIDGVEQIRPVVFLRRVLISRILEGQKVEFEDLEEIKERIDKKDTEYFEGFPNYLDALAAQKERQRSAFASWTPFTLLFYIDYPRYSEEVKDALRRIADFLRSELDLQDCEYHLAGFGYNQNFGTDNCWTAIYPPAAGSHQRAYQMFLGVDHNFVTVGLVPGDRLDLKERFVESIPGEEIQVDKILSFLSGKRALFFQKNRSIRSDPQEETTEYALNTILYGPPGTGKTYSVQKRALEIIEGEVEGLSSSEMADRFRHYSDEGRIEFVTFHSSYSYEEFIEGFRFDPEEKVPVLRQGTFARLAKRALNPDRNRSPHVLIIDEINRGNISKIFGELITLLEPDKREGAENQLTIRLPYSQEPFSVPSNLYVIGTMNTADRSIALLDVALRRRFHFQEMMPDVEVLRSHLSERADLDSDSDSELTPELIELICRLFQILNLRITVLLDRDHQLGHSYFMKISSVLDLHRLLYERVFPLLQEYFYNDRRRLIRLLGAYSEAETRGFVQDMGGDYSGIFEESETGVDEIPWEFHRYKVGELEKALRQTFWKSD